MSTVLVIGGTSAIGRAVARELAKRGTNVLIAGRDAAELDASAADLRVRHSVVASVLPFDALAFDTHEAFFQSAVNNATGELDGVILCHGAMTPQADAAKDFAATRQMIDVNYTSAVSVLNLAANYFEPLKRGYLCAVSSVAGDRGRQSNYIYGSAKAGLTAYLQGLRNRLAHSGIPVTTVKPGFVDTAMTWGLLKPGSPIVASPEKVAHDILRAIDRKRSVIYTPWFWWGIMNIIKSIPEPIFKKMKM